MEYVVVVIILIVLIGLVLPKQKQKKEPASFRPATRPLPAKSRSSVVSTTARQDTESGRLLDIEVDFLYRLRCRFLRNGSPWVEVEDLDHGFRSSYNVKTSRWKEEGCPVIPDYQRQLSKTLKSEWENAWEDFGRPEFGSGRKNPQSKPRPTSVDFTKREIQFVFAAQALAPLPKGLSAEGSEGAVYTINLDRLECSCPDFRKRRSEFPVGDIRRICKHQARALSKIKALKLTEDGIAEGLIRGYAYEGKGAYLYERAFEITINHEVKGPNPFYFFVPDGDSKWADVAFSTETGMVRRVYHIEEKRWGQHSNPFPEGTRQLYNLCVSSLAS